MDGRGVGADEVPLRLGQTVQTGHSLWVLVADPVAHDPSSLLGGISAAVGYAREEVRLLADLVAATLQRGERVRQALLITGPRGSGKQVVAREAQRLLAKARGRRVDEIPFRQIAAPALSDGTAAADLFGVADRYATGVAARPGLFEQAHGGILFIDEVGDTPLAEQAKLLNALQEREVTPFGARSPVPFDALVIGATNRALGGPDTPVREDLLDRLGRFRIDLPDLADRREDIPFLARMLLARHGCAAPIDHEVAQALMRHPFEGNVRALDALMERLAAWVKLRDQTLDVALLRRALDAVPAPRLDTGPKLLTATRSQRPTAEALVSLLDAVSWNKAEAARRMGTHRRQINRWLDALGIASPADDGGDD